MWIKRLPDNYSCLSSLSDDDVFLWKSRNVYVMDNHKSALWCWLQSCETDRNYNFMHIDRHYDMLECFYDEDLERINANPHIAFEEYSNLMRNDGEFKVFRWDNYIMAGYVLRPNWFHTNIFLTQQEGVIGKSWGHKPFKLREENPLYLEWYIQQYVEKPSKYQDGFKDKDYELPWIINLDLDVFFTGSSHLQLFSDDYIRRIAELLQNNLKRIAVLTIAISPDCLGGEEMKDKWENGLRLLSIMSDKLTCLKEFNGTVLNRS